MGISNKTIEEVKSVMSADDVVSEFVNLKPAGSRLRGLCPFHNEKTPSFYVSPSLNIYKCFGCGEAGDPITFLMEHEKMTYPEAIEWLAGRYQIPIEYTHVDDSTREKIQQEESLYLLNDYAANFYKTQLNDTDEGKSIGLTYLKERGYLGETIVAFDLGFAPRANDRFYVAATHDGYSPDKLKALGLVTDYGKDFFRDRIIFPIHGVSGKIIAFAGRILNSQTKAPKYINSPETDIYVKSKVLYGVPQAKKTIRKENEVYLVEGYTDVISLHQNGVKNVVASSGTALTRDQLLLIKRFTPNLTLLYDGDTAGIKAALRGLEIALEVGLHVKVALLPQGQDPDSYIRLVGLDDFNAFLAENKKDFIHFQLAQLQKEAGDDPIKRAQIIKDIAKTLGLIFDPIVRSVYTADVSKILGIDEALFQREINQSIATQLKKNKNKPRPLTNLPIANDPGGTIMQPASPSTSKDKTYHLEKELTRVLVLFGDRHLAVENMTVGAYMIEQVTKLTPDLQTPIFNAIYQFAKSRVEQGKSFVLADFVHHEMKEVRQFCTSVAHDEHEYSPNWEIKRGITLRSQPMPSENFLREMKQVLNRYKLHQIDALITENQRRLHHAQSDNDESKIEAFFRVQIKLNEMRSAVMNILGQVL